MDKYELGIAVQKIYDFIWEEFCDWYIEMVKPRLYNQEDTSRDAALWTLRTVLIQALKLLHLRMPFITEEIFCTIQEDEGVHHDLRLAEIYAGLGFPGGGKCHRDHQGAVRCHP